jgi:hypothetical protein
MFIDLSSGFQACAIWMARAGGGMDRIMSNREGLIKSEQRSNGYGRKEQDDSVVGGYTGAAGAAEYGPLWQLLSLSTPFIDSAPTQS